MGGGGWGGNWLWQGGQSWAGQLGATTVNRRPLGDGSSANSCAACSRPCVRRPGLCRDPGDPRHPGRGAGHHPPAAGGPHRNHALPRRAAASGLGRAGARGGWGGVGGGGWGEAAPPACLLLDVTPAVGMGLRLLRPPEPLAHAPLIRHQSCQRPPPCLCKRRRRATPRYRSPRRRCRCCTAWPAPSTSCCPPPTTTQQSGEQVVHVAGRGERGRGGRQARGRMDTVEVPAAACACARPAPQSARRGQPAPSSNHLAAAGRARRGTLRRRCCGQSTRAATTWRGRR